MKRFLLATLLILCSSAQSFGIEMFGAWTEDRGDGIYTIQTPSTMFRPRYRTLPGGHRQLVAPTPIGRPLPCRDHEAVRPFATPYAAQPAATNLRAEADDERDADFRSIETEYRAANGDYRPAASGLFPIDARRSATAPRSDD